MQPIARMTCCMTIEKGLFHSPRKGDTSSQFGIVASLR